MAGPDGNVALLKTTESVTRKANSHHGHTKNKTKMTLCIIAPLDSPGK